LFSLLSQSLAANLGLECVKASQALSLFKYLYYILQENLLNTSALYEIKMPLMANLFFFDFIQVEKKQNISMSD
jgi:hypothetical protein